MLLTTLAALVVGACSGESTPTDAGADTSVETTVVAAKPAVLPLTAGGFDTVLVLGNTPTARELASGLRSVLEPGALVEYRTNEKGTDPNEALSSWYTWFSKAETELHPRVVVLNVEFDAYTGCAKLLTAADTRACVAYSRQAYFEPQLQGMASFFADKGIPVLWVGYAPSSSAGSNSVLSVQGSDANKNLAELNAAISKQVKANGWSFFDPSEVLGESFVRWYKVNGSYEQWRAEDPEHLCISGARELAERLVPLLFKDFQGGGGVGAVSDAKGCVDEPQTRPGSEPLDVIGPLV